MTKKKEDGGSELFEGGREIVKEVAAKDPPRKVTLPEASALRTPLSVVAPKAAAPTKPQLNEVQIGKIMGMQQLLQDVQSLTDVPWECVASVWYRESGLSTVMPSTPGSYFQFDPSPDFNRLYAMLKRYISHKLSDGEIIAIAEKGIADFRTCALAAACLMRDKVKDRVTVNASDDLVKDMFWGYNGRAYGSADKSPYVMNMFDKDHMDMMIIGTIPDRTQPGGRRLIKNKDKNLGAFVVYKQLKGLNAVQGKQD